MLEGDVDDSFLASVPSTPSKSGQGSQAPSSMGSGRKKNRQSRGSEVKSKNGMSGSDSESACSATTASEFQRCWVCKKQRKKQEFKGGKSWCATACRQSDERLLRIAQQQGIEGWYKDLKVNDPGNWGKLVRDFEAKCPDKGFKKKREFYNMHTFKSEMFTEQGEKEVVRRKRMFEREWMEYAQTPEGGSYLESEALEEWKKAEANKNIKRDRVGPGKKLRLSMPYVVFDDSYVNLGTRQSLSGTKTFKKKPTEAAMMELVDHVVTGHGAGLDEDGKMFQTMQERTQTALGLVAKSSSLNPSASSSSHLQALSGNLAVVPDLKALATQAKAGKADDKDDAEAWLSSQCIYTCLD